MSEMVWQMFKVNKKSVHIVCQAAGCLVWEVQENDCFKSLRETIFHFFFPLTQCSFFKGFHAEI